MEGIRQTMRALSSGLKAKLVVKHDQRNFHLPKAGIPLSLEEKVDGLSIARSSKVGCFLQLCY
jgi:hypothetical protein